MEMFTGILSTQAPPKQTAATTIATLCDRLLHATLLEDRRAAVLGLRSFARDYKESVASGGLRGLIGTLAKDTDDVDTVKVVLETLLLLFVKEDETTDSPDDISLWLADEFTQKQDNISLLIGLLDKADFYERLYSLKILIAILKYRPDRAKECIYVAPFGISRLVATLEDRREIIRNEGVSLLIALTEDHTEIQKLVAFESAFERIFSIIAMDGGLSGGFLVKDCLKLLKNLLAFNVSNQSFFRETGWVTKLVNLFGSLNKDGVFSLDGAETNVIGVLDLCKVFVMHNGGGTHLNQLSFWQSGLAAMVLKLAFSPLSSLDIRTEALHSLADMIRGHHAIQESFAQHQVDASTLPVQEAEATPGSERTAFVIEALLNMALLDTNAASFNLRIAAVQCIEGYVYDNDEIRLHFLDRAVKGFTSGEDETANIFSALMELDSDSRADPYRTWLSSLVFMRLIYEHHEAQSIAMGLTVGDAETGEEVITAIQTLSANLAASLQYNLDPRISLAFLMVLCVWLFDNSEAVNDFLNEGSTVEAILAILNQTDKTNVMIQGMCAFLMGIVFEFSTKDSPIPRGTLHALILGRLSKDLYFHKLHKLRQHPVVRDVELISTQTKHKGLPEVYLSDDFIEFFKDNYSCILRALDQDPGDNHSGTGRGDRRSNMVSLEMHESVKLQLEAKEAELAKVEAAQTSIEHKLSQDHEEFRKFKETSGATLQRIKEVAAREIANARDETQFLREQYEADMEADREQHRAAIEELTLRIEAMGRDSRAIAKDSSETIEKLQQHIANLEAQLQNSINERNKLEEHVQKAIGERSNLQQSKHALEDQLRKLNSELNVQKDSILALAARQDEEKAELKRVSDLELKNAKQELGVKLSKMQQDAEQQSMVWSEKVKKLEAQLELAKKEIEEVDRQKEKNETEQTERDDLIVVMTERDDLLLVMEDLEASLSKYKARLQELGGTVTDDEGSGNGDSDVD